MRLLYCRHTKVRTCGQVRLETTGTFHEYQPGPIAKALRQLFASLSTVSLRKRVAQHFEIGLTKVARMEQEAAWIRRHGSPLRVMGLHDHCDLADVKARYTELVFELHPDQAPKETALAIQEMTGESMEVIRARQIEQLDLLKQSYKMATDPNSVWHLNCSAPHILAELRPHQSLMQRVVNPTSSWAILSWVLGGIATLFALWVVWPQIWEALVQLYDPAFYKFMIAEEKDDSEKKAMGEPVISSALEKYGTEKLKKLVSPGKFIHQGSDATMDS